MYPAKGKLLKSRIKERKKGKIPFTVCLIRANIFNEITTSLQLLGENTAAVDITIH